MLFETKISKIKSVRWVMKRISLLTAILLSFVVSGCYTQLATKDNSSYENDGQYQSEYEYYDSSSEYTTDQYSDADRDYGYTSDQEVYGDGEVIINNYYYDTRPSYRRYLSYYHPGITVSIGYGVWDPWYDPWCNPWDPFYVSWNYPWYSPYWYHPTALLVYPVYGWNYSSPYAYYNNNFGGTKYRNYYSPRVRNSGNGRGLYAGRNNAVRDRNSRNSNALLDDDVRSTRTGRVSSTGNVISNRNNGGTSTARDTRSGRTYLDDIRSSRNDDKGKPAVRNNSSRETSRSTDTELKGRDANRSARTYIDETRSSTSRSDRSSKTVNERSTTPPKREAQRYSPPAREYKTKESTPPKKSTSTRSYETPKRSVEKKSTSTRSSNSAGYQRKSSSSSSSKPAAKSYSPPSRSSSPSVSTPKSNSGSSRSSGTSSRSSSGGSSNSGSRTRR